MTDPKTELDDKIAELERQDTAIQQQLNVLKRQRAEFLCSFQVGDVLINKNGKQAIVQSILPSDWSFESYEVRGFLLRKDGTKGRITVLYLLDEWRKVKEGE